jgi:hypothetical protein
VYCTTLGKVLLASVSDDERRELLAGLDLIPQGLCSITVKSKLAAELDRIGVRDPVVGDEACSRRTFDRCTRPASARRASARDRGDRALERLHGGSARQGDRTSLEQTARLISRD